MNRKLIQVRKWYHETKLSIGPYLIYFDYDNGDCSVCGTRDEQLRDNIFDRLYKEIADARTHSENNDEGWKSQ